MVVTFALDEAQEQDNLDKRTRQMIILAATIATQTKKMYEVFVNSALDVGVSPVEIKEILYQNVGNDKQVLLNTVTALLPYIGYPRSLNAISCINQVIPE